MCNWESINKIIKCTRNNIQDSDFCLFHKPDKTEEEGKLFWKIINWDTYSALSSQELELLSKPWELSRYPKLQETIAENIETSILSNFTEDERNKSNFDEYKHSIKNQVSESKIWRQNLLMTDFTGFIFPVLPEIRFNYRLDFIDSGYGTMNFSEAIFKGPIIFNNYTFKFSTRFDNCIFERQVQFYSAKFLKRVSFSNVEFSNYSFLGSFTFEETQFNGTEVIFENNLGCSTIDFKGILFGQHTKFILKNMNFKKNSGVASYGEEAYRTAKIQSNRIGDFNTSSDYYYLEKCYKGYQILPEPYFWDNTKKGFLKITFFIYIIEDKGYKYILPKILDLIYKHSIGYGEKPGKALKSTIFIISFFAFLYMFGGNIKIDNSIINYDLYFGENLLSISHWIESLKDFGNCLYFSIVTFTTVGYGDITPVSGIGKFISGIEMFLGVTVVGAWTATLLRKIIK
jgi:hypothetical protein